MTLTEDCDRFETEDRLRTEHGLETKGHNMWT